MIRFSIRPFATSWSATNRAPGTPPRLRRRHRTGRGLYRDLRPGATNLVTPLADANLDSVPIRDRRTDQFRAHRNRRLPGSRYPRHHDAGHHTTSSSSAPRTFPEAIKAAFHIASTGRPGPVLVDIAKDALSGSAPFDYDDELLLPGYKPNTQPHIRQVKEAAKLICESKRPVLYIGGGVLKARAWQELADLVDLADIPVVTTLMARGAFPDDHPLHMGMPGMHGSVSAVGALQKSDLLIAVGTRFDDRVTGRLDSFAPDAKVIHADIDPAEIGKNRAVDVPVVGDAKVFLNGLIEALRNEKIPDFQTWSGYLKGLMSGIWAGPKLRRTPDAAQVIKRIGEIAGPDATSPMVSASIDVVGALPAVRRRARLTRVGGHHGYRVLPPWAPGRSARQGGLGH